MKKFVFVLLFTTLLQACSCAKLTPEEKEEIRERRLRLLEVRDFRV